jgi:phytoene dehydrogenase-like protein
VVKVEHSMIVIIGAGLAGLTCARELVKEGQRVLVLEAAEQVGGRIRTDMHEDGYRLDRGLQVLFTAYPAARRHLNFVDLKQRFFAAGVLLAKHGRLYELADPLATPGGLLPGLRSSLLSPADLLRIVRLSADVARYSVAEIFAGKGQPDGRDESIEAYLRRLGFPEQGFIASFARPFYGGILLDHRLATSARLFRFLCKMQTSGKMVLPAEGMQRVPEMLAATLPPGSLRLRARVSSLQVQDGRVSGVRLATGEVIEAGQVVVATERSAAMQLTGQTLPGKARSSVCLYFGGRERLYTQRKMVLNPAPDAYVNHATLVSNIAPTYAPPHRHLLSATIVDPGSDDDEEIERRARAEIATWFPTQDLQPWQILGIYRLPFSQLAQPPGFFDALPSHTLTTCGLYLAGEYTSASNIQGAMQSGEDVARAVLQAMATAGAATN